MEEECNITNNNNNNIAYNIALKEKEKNTIQPFYCNKIRSFSANIVTEPNKYSMNAVPFLVKMSNENSNQHEENPTATCPNPFRYVGIEKNKVPLLLPLDKKDNKMDNEKYNDNQNIIIPYKKEDTQTHGFFQTKFRNVTESDNQQLFENLVTRKEGIKIIILIISIIENNFL